MVGTCLNNGLARPGITAYYRMSGTNLNDHVDKNPNLRGFVAARMSLVANCSDLRMIMFGLRPFSSDPLFSMSEFLVLEGKWETTPNLKPPDLREADDYLQPGEISSQRNA